MRLLLCAFLTFSILSLFAEDTAAEWELKSIALKSGGIMKGLVSEQGLKVFIDLGSGRLEFYSMAQIEALPDKEKDRLRNLGAMINPVVSIDEMPNDEKEVVQAAIDKRRGRPSSRNSVSHATVKPPILPPEIDSNNSPATKRIPQISSSDNAESEIPESTRASTNPNSSHKSALSSIFSLLFYGFILFVAARILFPLLRFLYRWQRYRAIELSEVDSMEGIEFERYLKQVFTSRGYYVELTKASGDLGVDLIARSRNDKIAVQAKRQNDKVSRRAVSDAMAGMRHYGCNRAMVITNNYFQNGAIELAKSNDCELIDRDKLSEWIRKFRS